VSGNAVLTPTGRTIIDLPVVDPLLPVVRMEQVRPRDDGGDYEQFRLELDLRIVVNLNDCACRKFRTT
jgi:hypothetical protein